MKIWVIKHTGKTWWANMDFDKKLMRGEQEIAIAGTYFFRRKDAVEYMKSKVYPDFYEVVSAVVAKSKEDNRKRS